MAKGKCRTNFGGKVIYSKYKLFDVDFYADSEYHIYFATISMVVSENVKI
jgi:hypothetical protein